MKCNSASCLTNKFPFFLLLLFFVLLFACSSDDDNTPPVRVVPVDLFGEVQKAVNNLREVESIVVGADATILTLTDKSVLKLTDEHRVMDITQANAPVVKIGNNATWLVNNEDTKLKVVARDALSRTVETVCVTYDTKRVMFYFSNELILSLNRYSVSVEPALRIPQVHIKIENNQSVVDKELYLNMTVKIEDPDQLYTDGTPFEAVGRVKGRGNSTWWQPKKPYRIKLDEKARLLGMSNDKDWALLANFFDKTLLRNLTAFKISQIVGMDWTPGSRSVELYMNGTYQGVYSFTEHVKVSKERVNIDLVKASDTDEEAIKGDYFMELDFHFDEPYKFQTHKKYLPIMFKDPEEPTEQQFEYVESFFNTAESTLYSSDFQDPKEGYRKYIDAESFIKYFIVHELAKNVDGNMRGSCYLTLTSDGKIRQPLVWDFDIAFGNARHILDEGASSLGSDGWFIKTCSPWFDQLFKDPQFVAELKQKWNEVKPQLDLLPQFVKDQAALLEEAQRRNFSPRSAGGAGWDVRRSDWPDYSDKGSYDGELIYLTTFIEERLRWLDVNISAL